jgi:hypothetical protein
MPLRHKTTRIIKNAHYSKRAFKVNKEIGRVIKNNGRALLKTASF